MVNEDPISPDEFRVVCDHHLQGLCKKLRVMGVDAVAIERFDDASECVKIAEKEGRVIVTKGNNFIKLKKAVKFGHCYNVASEKPDEQVKIFNTQYINLK